MDQKSKHCEKVQVTVFNSSKTKVLILQTNERRGRFWQNITGSVEHNEDSIEAAKRELFEETGLRPVEIQKLQANYQFTDQWNREVNEVCYFCTVESEVVTIDNEEHEDFKWFATNEVSRDSYKYESNYEVFREALSKI